MTKREIPKFKSIREEARFWDTHDVTDYLSGMREVKALFETEIQPKVLMTIRVQLKLKRRLEAVARSCGLNVSTLTRLWIIEKLRELESVTKKSDGTLSRYTDNEG